MEGEDPRRWSGDSEARTEWWRERRRNRSRIAVSRCVVRRGEELAGVYTEVDIVGDVGVEGS